MANLVDKLIDLRHKSIHHIRIDTTEGAAVTKINPELLYGAQIDLTVSAAGTDHIRGEIVTQAAGGKGVVTNINADGSLIRVTTARDSVAVFNTSEALVGDESTASKTPSVKVVPHLLTLSVAKIVHSNSGFTTVGDRVLISWDAATDEVFSTMIGGDGRFEMPGAVIKPGVISGQTGSINTFATITTASFASILIETHKFGSGFQYLD